VGPNLMKSVGVWLGTQEFVFRFVCKSAAAFYGSSKIPIDRVATSESIMFRPIHTYAYCGTSDGYGERVAKARSFMTSVKMARWAHEYLYMPLSRLVCCTAIDVGVMEVVDWVRTNAGKSFPNDDRLTMDAAMKGHMEMMKWARAQKPPYTWSSATCIAAAGNGHIKLLKWLRAQDPPCPWDEVVCSTAARNGHLKELKWLRAQDPPCPWDAEVCYNAAGGGHLDVLQWARKQDPPCPWDMWVCNHAATSNNQMILIWSLAQEPPPDWDMNACVDFSQKAQGIIGTPGSNMRNYAQNFKLLIRVYEKEIQKTFSTVLSPQGDTILGSPLAAKVDQNIIREFNASMGIDGMIEEKLKELHGKPADAGFGSQRIDSTQRNNKKSPLMLGAAGQDTWEIKSEYNC